MFQPSKLEIALTDWIIFIWSWSGDTPKRIVSIFRLSGMACQEMQISRNLYHAAEVP